MKILIIIITYNGKHWMDSCLGSLLASTVKPDVIVIDNLSSDGTPDYIEKRFPQFELIRSDKNLGFGKANNIGLKKALKENYDYAFLLNQDAWVAPDTFEILIKLHRHHSTYGIISPMHLSREKTRLDDKFTQYICRDNDVDLMSDLLLKQKAQSLYPVSFVNAAAWLISRACLEKVGGFDPIFPHYGEDNDYINRAAYFGFKTGFTPDTWIVHDRKGYVKQPDMPRTFAHQYTDHLRTLKNVRLSFRRSFLFILKDEVFYAFIALAQLDFSMFFVKIRLVAALTSRAGKIRKSRKYCINSKTAYLN